MALRFTNTLGGDKVPFEPLDPPRVGIYVCGPTVYDVPHVGHARAAVVFDTLRRYLAWSGYDVFFVRNITDIDDRIIDTANTEGVDVGVIADRYTRAYEHAMDALNVLPPDVSPRATGHVLEMQDLIAKLISKDHAYANEGSVYFAVEKFADYGKLSGRPLDELKARERVEPAPGKLHPLDFALWKAAKPGEPHWPSPWGPGRPGWHIECSAMAVRYLGMPFDVHGGGADLIFPHHENEIAQSEAGLGPEPFVRVWLHNGHVQIEGEKMSKSLKNYVRVDEALADYPPQALRLFFAGAQYRSQMSYGVDALDESRAVWERFRAYLRAAPERQIPEDVVREHLQGFADAMDDDLNTPVALSVLHTLTAEGHKALEAGDEDAAALARAAVVEGLDILGCVTYEEQRADVVGPLVEFLLEQREAAREAKAFDRADAIRERLHNLGVRVEDSSDGPRWHLE